jgi:hypothetical protein
MAEVNHYRAIDECYQASFAQVDQLLVELETLQVKQQLCQGRLEMGHPAQQIEHLCLGQNRAHWEHKRVHINAVHLARHG